MAIDSGLVSKLLYNGALAAGCTIAARRGGFDERVGVAILVAGSAATALATPIAHFVHASNRLPIAFVNLATLAAFDALMIKSRRAWTIWVVGFQLATVSLDWAMEMWPIDVRPYFILRGKLAYPILACLVIGGLRRRHQGKPERR